MWWAVSYAIFINMLGREMKNKIVWKLKTLVLIQKYDNSFKSKSHIQKW